ncbi:MAG: endo-1,4-beta-xylanase [Bacteroidota bacterium]
MHRTLLLLLFVLPMSLLAQDNYHTYLTTLFGDDFGLPQGQWVFYDNESQIYQNAIGYGGNFSVQNATDQVFARQQRCFIGSAGNNPWDAGWTISNKSSIQAGDKMMAVFFIRSVNGPGEVNFFAENNTTFAKEVYLNLPLTEEWQRYIVSFESMASYAVNTCNWGFHMGNVAQTIEIGGFTAINYQNEADLSDLPSEINNEFYGGYEADAPWRAEADARIDQFRKADFNLVVRNTAGELVENEAVELKMLRHRFDFGSAILASRIANNPDYNVIYENKITNLDGNGRGFNTVVFENDLKWDGWEQEWFVTKPELQTAVSWLKENNLKIRGHNLVWPGTPYMPDDIPQNYSNISYLQQRINGRLEEVMLYPGVGPEIHDWDVLNEITVNQDLANAFAASPDYETGRELYIEIFEKARELDPDVGLWLNDYVTLSLNTAPGNAEYDRLKQFTGELVNSTAPIDGLGFQGHIGGIPNSIYDVLATLDDFYDSFGLKAKITEFDLPSFVDEELAGNYLRDFMTAIYSHESMDGFLFWSFWDGQTYMNAGTNLYRLDWSETPCHAAFTDLLFNQWWTEESLVTNTMGAATVRGFKGTYEVSYECNGTTVRDTINLAEAMDYEIVCDNILTDVEELPQPARLKVFPNPARGFLKIERGSGSSAQIRLLDAIGRVVFQTQTTDRELVLEVEDYQGVYVLEVRMEDEVFVEKVVME